MIARMTLRMRLRWLWWRFRLSRAARVLCALGWHTWLFDDGDLYNDASHRVCLTCGRGAEWMDWP